MLFLLDYVGWEVSQTIHDTARHLPLSTNLQAGVRSLASPSFSECPNSSPAFNPSSGEGHRLLLLDFQLACCVLAEQRRTSSRQDRLLLGEQVAKDIFHSLPELETLVRIEDHGLHECLGLLTTRFPNGFDGQAPLHQ